MLSRIKNIILLFIGLVAFSANEANGQEKKEISAYRLQSGEEIFLDGWVNEDFWDKVSVAGDFRQQEPFPGNPATEQTEVRISYDDEYLYIGAIFFDSESDKITAFQKKRDAPLDTDDRFVFILDTYNDQRSAFYFEINPLGLMGDGKSSKSAKGLP